MKSIIINSNSNNTNNLSITANYTASGNYLNFLDVIGGPVGNYFRYVTNGWTEAHRNDPIKYNVIIKE